MEKNKLIAIYGRVSTSNQENEGTIETQLSAVYKFAEEKGYIIVEKYIDDGWSGDIIERPGLDQLRIDAKKKKWEAVLIYDPDRLGRRLFYQQIVIDELKEFGIEILFVTMPPVKSASDELLFGVRGLFAQYEKTKIAERFRLGKLRKVMEGHLLVSEALYGYKYIKMVDRVHGYYEINPEEARVVKMIFNWIGEEGMNLRQVILRLQELGIKPRKSKRGVWNTSTLTTMLRNKGYIGEAHWGSTYAVVPENPTSVGKYKKVKKSSRKTKPESEWITSKIPIPVIISKELFEKTRLQLEKNFSLCVRNTKHEYLLNSKIWCTCGSRRVGQGSQRGKHLYYRCTDRIHSFPLPQTCKEGGINTRVADNLLWQKMSELMTSPELMLKQINRWLSTKQSKSVFNVGDVDQIEKEIQKVKLEEVRYNKAYGAGLFTLDQLKEYTTPVREKLTALELQINKAKEEERQIEKIEMPKESEIEIFANKTREALVNLSFSVKKAIIRNVTEKIVASQQELQICGYIPITTENNVLFFSSHRNRRSAKCR